MATETKIPSFPTWELDNVPADLTELTQWVCWRAEPRAGKITKVPHRTQGDKASATDPATWTTFEAAAAAYESQRFTGVGFVVTAEDPICGVDLDHCRDSETGAVTPEAQRIVDELDSYTEVSPSGEGLRIFIRASLANLTGSRRQWFEVYDRDRYLTVTGLRLPGAKAEVAERQSALDTIHERMIGQHRPSAPPAADATIAAVPVDDQELLQRMFRAANGASVAQLYGGQWEAAGYPSQSEADFKLLCDLAFWTGRDAVRMDRLFRGSGLMREKWDSPNGGSTYGARTIARAIENTAEVYRAGNGHSPAYPPNQNGGSPPSNGNAHVSSHFPEIYSLTQWGNAERLAARVNGTYRYVESRGQWYRYTGGRFIDSKDRGIILESAKVSDDILAEAVACESNDRKQDLAKHAQKSLSAAAINSTVDLARAKLAVTPDQLDVRPDVLNFRNGLLELRTRALLPHRPEQLVTKRTDYEYEPGATCPKWFAFMDRTFSSDPERIAFMQRIFGACLLAEKAFSTFFVLYGTGANGKSVLLSMLRALLGDYAKQTSTNVFTNQNEDPQGFRVFPLRAARVVTAVETKSGTRLNENLIKTITGGEPFEAAPKYGHGETFEPVWKILMATNHKPVIYGQDPGIWRRICFIKFDVQIPKAEQIKMDVFTAMLREELPGILNWALDGLDAYLRYGLDEPDSVLAENEAYKSEQDVLGDWLEANCVLGPGHRTPTAALFNDYSAFSVQAGDEPIGKKRFGSSLEERGCASIRGTGGIRFRTGICLKSTCEDSPVGDVSDVSQGSFQSQSDVSDVKSQNFGDCIPRKEVSESDVTGVTNVTNAPGCECPSPMFNRVDGKLYCTGCQAVWE